MGTVYVGQHVLLGRRAAIKVLLPALSARREIIDRFFNEARAVTSISDLGIVQVFDFGYHTDGSAFIVMELLEGETLDARLTRMGRLPVPVALRLCRQIASSLAAAHAKHIVHRDLKPENVFLVRDGEVASGERSKILDFGIAKLSDEKAGSLKTHTGSLLGTPTYMSPEQCRGLSDIDPRADIYALGCVMFHLLTGRPPFEGEASGDVIAAHIREPAPPPSSRASQIPPSVDALVLRCLAKAPRDRFPTMKEFVAAIGAVQAHLPPEDPPAYLQPTRRLSPATDQLKAAVQPGIARQNPDSVAGTTLGGSTGHLVRSPIARSRGVQLGLWAAGVCVVGFAVVAIVTVAGRSDDAPDALSAPQESNTASALAPNRDDARVDSPLTHNDQAPKPERAQQAQEAENEQRVVAPVPPATPEPSASAGVKAVDSPASKAEPDNAQIASKAAVNKGAALEQPRTRRSRRDAAGARESVPVNEPSSVADLAADNKAQPRPNASLPPARSEADVKGASLGRCTKALFAKVYNAQEVQPSAVSAALRSLKTCHDAGAIGDIEFDQIQQALVARM